MGASWGPGAVVPTVFSLYRGISVGMPGGGGGEYCGYVFEVCAVGMPLYGYIRSLGVV
jgi:hypothetical protein